MNTKIGLLGGVLAAQILLVLALLVSSDGMGGEEESAGLLPFAATEAVSLGVASPDEEVALSRGDDGWQLDSGLPVDDSKITEVLEKLAKVSTAWPVATSAETAERFEVTEENFQRRLLFENAAGDTATLYLGSSPGYRRVHARAEGADEVYSIDFSNYEAPIEAGAWLDKDLLRARGDVVGVALADGWTLARGMVETEGTGQTDEADAGDEADIADLSDEARVVDAADEPQWLIDGAPADQDAANRLVKRFEDFNVLDIVAEEGEPKGALTIQDADGEYRLDLYFHEDEDEYSVASSRVDGRFRMATYIAEQILVDADDLLPEPEEPEEPEEPKSTSAP